MLLLECVMLDKKHLYIFYCIWELSYNKPHSHIDMSTSPFTSNSKENI